jgi:hypothetical protein
MNTIHSTFNGDLPEYTVVGGSKRNAYTGLCAVLLCRGGRYARNSCFKELQSSGFDYVLSMETAGEHFDVDELAALFPFVRFILFKGTPNIGRQINVAAIEAETPLFFVLWNDFHPVLNLEAERIAGRLLTKPSETEKYQVNKQYARLCTVPVIQNPQFETIPSAKSPLITGKKFEIVPFAPVKEGAPTLYPFDASGIYDKSRFIELGGFDPKLNSAHWQFLDFGIRAWLWGEEIRCSQYVRFRLDGTVNAENSTTGESYLRFFLKNLAPVIRKEFAGGNGAEQPVASAHLPLKTFPAYLMNSDYGLQKAFSNFIEIRGWIKSNSRRFVNDINGIAAFWD